MDLVNEMRWYDEVGIEREVRKGNNNGEWWGVLCVCVCVASSLVNYRSISYGGNSVM